ncbi:predicted protein [Plenodomus lingam JN3]|uniref:Predicted protein n=1 Tax=Leptosphaeria maculans (strain JN3 / isolate v23.1.3 / race Av1-4-5-6-7-8) TaxID=985895 RepID=E4ZZA9_LEPMJ|nr:predicted protein [Plenodomus lingam JN3]CBX96704.1 predicted protein [Plenodomus lingam JN3]
MVNASIRPVFCIIATLGTHIPFDLDSSLPDTNTGSSSGPFDQLGNCYCFNISMPPKRKAQDIDTAPKRCGKKSRATIKKDEAVVLPVPVLYRRYFCTAQSQAAGIRYR